MLILRSSFRFCRAQAYLQRFKALEEEVNRKQKQLIEKKEQLKRLQQLGKMTPMEKAYQSISMILSRPYQSEAVSKQKERLKSMFTLLEDLQKQSAERTRISKKLAQEQKLRRQKIFITDLARFANKYHQLAQQIKTIEVKEGLQLSCKGLQSKLQKEGIEFIGDSNDKFNRQIHEKTDGEGEVITAVLQRGIKTRGQLMSKAKVSCRK